jgi:hypothetical protein
MCLIPHPAATWAEFAAAVPELAAFAAARLGAATAYLATVREDGVPRVHPVTPVVSEERLFVFMEPTSPKGGDLRERGWYSLHNGVPDSAGTGGELLITGRARPVTDDTLRKLAVESASYDPAARYILFELSLTEVRGNGYGYITLPTPSRWTARAPLG